jgi:sulfur carrier protein ThiS
MSAYIRPIGHLKTFTGNQTEVIVSPGQTVREALKAVGIKPELVALVLVNEEHQDKDYVLQENDVVKVLAVIGGGSIDRFR